jgi:hypothetical protein
VPWAGHIPSFLRVDDPAVQRILAGGSGAATKVHRVTATATTPLGLAEMLGLTAPFAMHFVLGRYPLYARLAMGLYIPLAIYVILLTDSRLGVVACLISVMFYLLIWAAVRWYHERKSLFAPAIVLAYPGSSPFSWRRPSSSAACGPACGAPERSRPAPTAGSTSGTWRSRRSSRTRSGTAGRAARARSDSPTATAC